MGEMRRYWFVLLVGCTPSGGSNTSPSTDMEADLESDTDTDGDDKVVTEHDDVPDVDACTEPCGEACCSDTQICLGASPWETCVDRCPGGEQNRCAASGSCCDTSAGMTCHDTYGCVVACSDTEMLCGWNHELCCDLMAGMTCDGGRCVADCTDDETPCANEQLCCGGAELCVFDEQCFVPEQSCVADGDCLEGQFCDLGLTPPSCMPHPVGAWPTCTALVGESEVQAADARLSGEPYDCVWAHWQFTVTNAGRATLHPDTPLSYYECTYDTEGCTVMGTFALGEAVRPGGAYSFFVGSIPGYETPTPRITLPNGQYLFRINDDGLGNRPTPECGSDDLDSNAVVVNFEPFCE